MQTKCWSTWSATGLKQIAPEVIVILTMMHSTVFVINVFIICQILKGNKKENTV